MRHESSYANLKIIMIEFIQDVLLIAEKRTIEQF